MKRGKYQVSRRGLQGAEIMVDLERGEIWVKDHENRLTPAELRLLAILCRREGRPITVELLAKELDRDPAGCGGGNPRFHISNLRRKLGHGPDRPVIATRTGIGYYLVPGAINIKEQGKGEPSV